MGGIRIITALSGYPVLGGRGIFPTNNAVITISQIVIPDSS